MKLNFDLSPAIAGKYEVVNTSFPVYHHKLGQFDFRTITEEDAKLLAEAGSMYIRPIKIPKSNPRSKIG